MITQATRARLLIFVVLTLVGIAYVGARYAEVDRMIVDRSYEVTVDLTESGGIFVGADVSYRGVSVGRVSDLELGASGVDATLTIEDDFDEIPTDLTAAVANKSAVGEQYVDLQPNTDDEPYLADGSVIEQSETKTPISTQTFLADVSAFVGSVNAKDLRTVVHELGVGFDGTGHDLSKIIDTSNSFIETADQNFGVTARLIRHGSTVLEGQIASGSSIRSFSRDLADFSQALRDSDADLRTVLDDTPQTVRQIGALLAENKKPFGRLLANLTNVNRVATAHLPGLQGVLVLAPYAVENGYSVLSKNPRTGKYEIRLGLATSVDPGYCKSGYTKFGDIPSPVDEPRSPLIQSVCKEPAAKSNARGVQNAQTPDPSRVVGVYDPKTERFTPGVPDDLGRPAPVDGGARSSDESWTRLLAAPSATR
ncbi:MAG TPA: MlaD family protein [Nocardioidaceae bacterium]|nr:MlaD family protein [Nocardioidaceae bacterium]